MTEQHDTRLDTKIKQVLTEARVVYVDSDQVAVAHSRAILTGNEKATVVQGDLREPDKAAETVNALLTDFPAAK